jgi:hypothetical protein
MGFDPADNRFLPASTLGDDTHPDGHDDHQGQE